MAETFSLSYDARARLVLHREGQPDATDARIRRSFPWSDPDRKVSIRGSDGKELLLIDDLSQLEAPTRELVQKYLDRVQFIPRITRVHTIDTRFGYQIWTAETDRGPAIFRIQEREDVRFLADGRFRLKDVDGNVYELPDLSSMDEITRRAVEAIV